MTDDIEVPGLYRHLRSAIAGVRPGDGSQIVRALTDGEWFLNSADGIACFLGIDGSLITLLSTTGLSGILANVAALQTATATLAPLYGPAFTGAPTAPTPPASDSSTRLATTLGVAQYTCDIRQFATVLKPFGAGGDDTQTWQAALAWALAGGSRQITLPSGQSFCSATLSGAITGGNSLSIVCAGRHSVTFADGVDGFALTRDYNAGCFTRGLSVVRHVIANGVGEVGTGFLLDYNDASSTSGIPGLVHLYDLVCRADVTNYGWHCGARIVNTSGAYVPNYGYYGRNASATAQPFNQTGYDPGAYSCGIWIQGRATTVGDPNVFGFSIQTNMPSAIAVGGQCGLRTTGRVQGAFALNPCFIGNDYGALAQHQASDVAELVSIGPGGTFACAVENIRMQYVGTPEIGMSQHLRFFADASRSWTAVHLIECNGYVIAPQHGVGGGVGSECGIWDESGTAITAGMAGAGNAGASPGTIYGYGIQTVAGPWLRLKGTVANKTITAASAAGVGVQDVDRPAQNAIFGNTINGGVDLTADGYGNLTTKGQLVVASLLPNANNSRTLGGGAPYTWAEVWTQTVINSAGPVSVGAAGGSGLYPQSDNALSLGNAGMRWSQLYAATSTIATSDATDKTTPRDFTDAELDAWGSVRAKVYKFNEAVARKGDKARNHFGYTAQAVRDAFAAAKLDATAYGFFCADTVPVMVQRTRTVQVPVTETYEATETSVTVVDGKATRSETKVERTRPRMQALPLFHVDGTPVMTAAGRGAAVQATHLAPVTEDATETYWAPDGTRQQLGLRYDACAAIEAAWTRRELAQLARRVAALEPKVTPPAP